MGGWTIGRWVRKFIPTGLVGKSVRLALKAPGEVLACHPSAKGRGLGTQGQPEQCETVPGLHHATLKALTSCPCVMPITLSEGLSTDAWYPQP